MTSENAIKILKKNDAPYLNSKARITKKIIFSLIEYAIVTLLVLMMASYMDSGTLDNMFNMDGPMQEMLRPGGFVFNSLIAYLPILILANVGNYFGSGSTGRLAIGILRCIAIALWLTLLLNSAATSIEIPSIAKDQGLESIEIGVKGLAKFALFVTLVCVIIPIGEYIGARKKHIEAVRRKESDYKDV